MTDHAVQLPDLAESERIRRYVRAQLQGAELQAFERKLLVDSLLQGRVEAEFVLRENAGALATNEPTSRREKLPIAALAASLLIGLAGGVLLSEAWRAPHSAAQQIDSVSFTVARTAAANLPSFRARAGVPLAARFLTASDVPHRLQIRDHSGALLSELAGLVPDADGDLIVLLPAFAASGSPLRLSLISDERSDEFELVVADH